MVKLKSEYTDFGIHVLRAMREEAELSQQEIASRLGTTMTTISNWESGKSSPDVIQFQSWCRACHKDGLPYLLSWEHPQTVNDTPYTQALKRSIDYMPPEYQQMLNNALQQDFWPILLQILTVYLNVPLRGRIIATENLLAIHRAAHNELHLRPERIGRETIQPDLNLIQKAMLAALEATRNGQENYYLD